MEKRENQTLVNQILVVISVIAIILGGGIGWGLLQARVDNVIRENTMLRSDIEVLKKDSVRRDEFQNIVKEIKTDNATIKDDIKKILEKLSYRSR